MKWEVRRSVDLASLKKLKAEAADRSGVKLTQKKDEKDARVFEAKMSIEDIEWADDSEGSEDGQ